jgi:two-component system, OmpR family, flagellar system response regulator FtcR
MSFQCQEKVHKMIIITGHQIAETNVYSATLNAEGLAANVITHRDFEEWFLSLDANDKSAIETIVIQNHTDKSDTVRLIKSRSNIPVVVVNSSFDLDSTLKFFLSGADDVVTDKIQPRELVARIGAIRRRTCSHVGFVSVGPLKVYFDGRDVELFNKSFILPRRERRILEYLAANLSRRVNRTMIFNAVYGLFEEEVEESVVESHISKLRKKLRQGLNFDPIDNQRYLGYQLIKQAFDQNDQMEDLQTSNSSLRRKILRALRSRKDRSQFKKQ